MNQLRDSQEDACDIALGGKWPRYICTLNTDISTWRSQINLYALSVEMTSLYTRTVIMYYKRGGEVSAAFQPTSDR